MDKKDFCEALKGGKVQLVRTKDGYSREYLGSYNRFLIYVDDLNINHHNSPWIADFAYYVKRSGVLAMTVWGMSQTFEAKYKVSMACCYEELGEYNHNYIYDNLDKIKILG